jgi:hypothetical protein
VIVRFLKWALSKFENKPTLEEKLAAWPFPAEEAPKAKPRVAKATTRKPVAKKATTVAKKATPKKAK